MLIGITSQACQADGVLKLGQEERCSICCLARVNIMACWPRSCTETLFCHMLHHTTVILRHCMVTFFRYYRENIMLNLLVASGQHLLWHHVWVLMQWRDLSVRCQRLDWIDHTITLISLTAKLHLTALVSCYCLCHTVMVYHDTWMQQNILSITFLPWQMLGASFRDKQDYMKTV